MKTIKSMWLALPFAYAALHGSTSTAMEVHDLKGISVVLVHGAFADGSSWSKVIPLLEARGLHAVAVQNPLTSLADDAAAARRTIDQQDGPVVLVGHSWGGAVITEAGNDPKVKALVYVAAFAPDADQSIGDLQASLPAPSWASKVIKDPSDFQTLPDAVVRDDFAQDVTTYEARLIAATQGPWALRCMTDKIDQPAWKSRPSWYVVGERDHMIAPVLQERMAATIQAHVVKVQASHVAMISQPKAVADAIIAAADSGR